VTATAAGSDGNGQLQHQHQHLSQHLLRHAHTPPEVTQFAKDCHCPNKDYSNTRATMDSAINASNGENAGRSLGV